MASKDYTLTQHLLKQELHYNQESGVFTRNKNKGDQIKIGDIAGNITKTGYVEIGVLGKRYRAHRLAFLYVQSKFPCKQVDHINHNKTDNRWSNLRGVSNMENGRNQKKRLNNKSGAMGVTWNKKANKWQSSITLSGKSIYLGLFDIFSDAVCARKMADIKYGFHKNHGE